MSHSGWDSRDNCDRGSRKTRLRKMKGRRTSTPAPSYETSSSEDFDDELSEFTYHFWLKALQREDRRRRRFARSKLRRNPSGATIPPSCPPPPPPPPTTITSSAVSLPEYLPSNATSQSMFLPHLPVRSHYIMSHTYCPSENPASLVFIRPSPLYLPPPNTALHCCPVLGYNQNGTIGVIPYTYYCFYM